MFSFDGSITGINNLFKDKPLPRRSEWHKLGLGEAKEIRQRTETRGKDAENRPFKPYSQAYAAYRADKGRKTQPNLSFSGKMLGALGSNVQPSDDSVKITLSGEEGMKAWENAGLGREFLGVPDDRLTKLAETFGDLVFKRI